MWTGIEHRSVQRQHPLGAPLQREFIVPALSAGDTVAATLFCIGRQFRERCGQCCRIIGRHKQTRFAIAHNETDARTRHVAGDCGQ